MGNDERSILTNVTTSDGARIQVEKNPDETARMTTRMFVEDVNGDNVEVFLSVKETAQLAHALIGIGTHE